MLGSWVEVFAMADSALPLAINGAYFSPREPAQPDQTQRLRLGRKPMRVLAVGVLLALLTIPTLPAHAQGHGAPPQEMTGPEEIAQKRKEEAAEVEKAYKSTLKNTSSSTAATKADPWGNVRSAEPVQAKQNPQSKNPK
jgi:hypothetical protein